MVLRMSPSAQFVLECLRPGSLVFVSVVSLMALGGFVEIVWYRRRRPYPWRELGHSLPAGVAASAWFATVVLVLEPTYTWLSGYAMLEIRLDGIVSWVALFLLVDFGYYWHHRLAHRVRWMWALHAPHHSVQELTLFNALRFSWSEATVGWIFMNVPAVLLGFPPTVVPAVYVVIGAYQYWIHNTLVGGVGPLELFLATPSHHRVHHSTEDHHLDRNFGGLLIVFDRLLGTFVAEGEWQPRGYGILGRRYDRFSDVLLGEVTPLISDLRQAPGLWSKLKIAFGRP